MAASDRERMLAGLAARVSRGKGTLDPAIRTAALDGATLVAGAPPLPANLRGFVDKVRTAAWTVGEKDIDALRDRDLSEDQIFELTIASAVGAGFERLEAAIGALRGVTAATKGTAE